MCTLTLNNVLCLRCCRPDLDQFLINFLDHVDSEFCCIPICSKRAITNSGKIDFEVRQFLKYHKKASRPSNKFKHSQLQYKLAWFPLNKSHFECHAYPQVQIWQIHCLVILDLAPARQGQLDTSAFPKMCKFRTISSELGKHKLLPLQRSNSNQLKSTHQASPGMPCVQLTTRTTRKRCERNQHRLVVKPTT